MDLIFSCYSLEFDGSTSYVDCPWEAGAIGSFTGGYTVEAWIYLESSSCACHRRILYVQDDWELSVDSTGVLKHFTEDGTSDLLSTEYVPTYEWVHVAATHDGSTTTLWMNGVEVASGGRDLPTGSGNALMVGYSNSSNHFLGMIDEVHISEGVLYENEFTPERYREPDSDTVAA